MITKQLVSWSSDYILCLYLPSSVYRHGEIGGLKKWEKVKVTVVAGQVRRETHPEAGDLTDRPVGAKVNNVLMAIHFLDSHSIMNREACLCTHRTAGDDDDKEK